MCLALWDEETGREQSPDLLHATLNTHQQPLGESAHRSTVDTDLWKVNSVGPRWLLVLAQTLLHLQVRQQFSVENNNAKTHFDAKTAATQTKLTHEFYECEVREETEILLTSQFGRLCC